MLRRLFSQNWTVICLIKSTHEIRILQHKTSCKDAAVPALRIFEISKNSGFDGSNRLDLLDNDFHGLILMRIRKFWKKNEKKWFLKFSILDIISAQMWP